MSLRSAVISTVLIVSLPLQTMAHDIYSALKDRQGRNCCNSMDCQPAPYQVTPSGVRMFVDGRWINVPNEKIQYLWLSGDRGDTGGGHWCGSGFEIDTYEVVPYVTKCAILPPHGQ